jgi:DNA-binding NarL/FixJ family response regulator
MPGGGGVTATERIGRAAPGVRVLVLTMHADSARVREALRAGARGYIVKDAPPDDILRAVEAVHADQAILDPAVAGALMTAGRGPRVQAFPQLTERELDVLERMSGGATNDAIAARLGISVKTVQNHVSNVLLKLGVASRAAAVARARDAGLGAGA